MLLLWMKMKTKKKSQIGLRSLLAWFTTRCFITVCTLALSALKLFFSAGLPLPAPLHHAGCLLVRGLQAGGLLHLRPALVLWDPSTTAATAPRSPTAPIGLLLAFQGEFLPQKGGLSVLL